MPLKMDLRVVGVGLFVFSGTLAHEFLLPELGVTRCIRNRTTDFNEPKINADELG